MTAPSLTDPQRRALAWMTAEWQEADRSISAAAGSLCFFHPKLAIRAWRYTPRGRRHLAYRLTEAGLAEQARAHEAPQ